MCDSIMSLDDLPLVTVEASSCSSGSTSTLMEHENKGSDKKVFLLMKCNNLAGEISEEIDHSRFTQSCNLSSLSLSSIPPKVPLESLTKLCLADNQLRCIPQELFTKRSARWLKELDLNSNLLSSIPIALFELPELEILLLNHNRIVELPSFDGAEVCVLALKLTRIELEFNCLNRFPDELFSSCPRLQHLFLGYNETMLDTPVRTDYLQCSAVAWRCNHSNASVHLQMDNRPRFLEQVAKEEWHNKMPWLQLSFHKIYPDKILDFLFLGSIRTAQTVQVYRDLDIKYVLTLGRNLEVKLNEGMKHLVINLSDFPGEDILSVMEEAFAFINESRKEGKGILIHCFAGLSRSVSITIGYLMKFENMTCDDAFNFIKRARPAAQPNSGFMMELRNYEEILKKEKQNKLPERSEVLQHNN